MSVQEQLATLEAVGRQRTAEAKGAAPMYIHYVPEREELTDSTPTVLREASEYYRTPRGQHPRSSNKLLFTSADKILAFSAFAPIHALLHKPMLLIAGDKADTRYFAEEAYTLANEPKELFWIKGATHVDMYDRPQYVEQAVQKMKEFFKTMK